jgi:aminopeptidase N
MLDQVFNSAVEEVKSSFPSVYTKDDVEQVLMKFKAAADAEIAKADDKLQGDADSEVAGYFHNAEDAAYLIRAFIKRNLSNMSADELVDYESAEFTINYGNTLELECIDTCNYENIVDELTDGLVELLEDNKITMAERFKKYPEEEADTTETVDYNN